jgi:hypothetical protein
MNILSMKRSFILVILSFPYHCWAVVSDLTIVNNCTSKVATAKSSIVTALATCPNTTNDEPCRAALSNLSLAIDKGGTDTKKSGDDCLESKSPYLLSFVNDMNLMKGDIDSQASETGSLIITSSISAKSICDRMKNSISGMQEAIPLFKAKCGGLKTTSESSVALITTKKTSAHNICHDVSLGYSPTCIGKLDAVDTDAISSFNDCKIANDKYAANLLAVDTNLVEMQRISTTTNTCSDMVTVDYSVPRNPASEPPLTPAPLITPTVSTAPVNTFDRLSQFFASHPEYFLNP